VLTILTTLIAAAWTALVVDAVIETGPGTGGVRAIGRVFEIAASNPVWLAAAAGASVIVLWLLAAWSFAGRRARRRASVVAGAGARTAGFGAIDGPTPRPLQAYLAGPEAIELDRLASMQTRIAELQDRVRTLSADQSLLRDDTRRLRRELGIPELPPQWVRTDSDEPGGGADPGGTAAPDAPVVLSVARHPAPSPSRSRR
jgi:hypothetical protein